MNSGAADRAFRAFAWAALLLALYRLFLALGNDFVNAGRQWISSDSLYPVHVFIDTVLEGNSFGAWRFSIAPCWFPDLFFTALFMAVTRNVIGATLLAGFIQLGLLIVGLRLLWKSLGYRPGSFSEVAALSAAVAVTLHIANHPAANPFGFMQFFLPQSHVGSLLLTIYGLAFAVRIANGADDRWLRFLKGGFAVVCFLGGFSDLIFVVQMLIPLTVVLAIAVFADLLDRRMALYVVAAGWPAALSGYAINRFFLPTAPLSAQSQREFSQIHLAFVRFMNSFFSRIAALDLAHVLAVFWLGITTAIAVIVVRRVRQRGRNPVPSEDRMLAILMGTFALSGPVCIAAVILGGSTTLTTINNYDATLRYAQTAFLLPFVALPFLAGYAIEQHGRFLPASRIAAAVLSVVVLFTAWSSVNGTPKPASPITQYISPLGRYLDELARRERLEVGVAGYWQARAITLLSRTGLKVYAVTPDMEPFLWVSNKEWYAGLFDEGDPKVDFVVLDDPLFHLDAPAAIKKFGKPSRVTAFEGTRVLLYRCRTCSWNAGRMASTWLDEVLTEFPQKLTSSVKELVLKPGERTTVTVNVRNLGRMGWASTGQRPVNLSYRVRRDGVQIAEGERTAFPEVIPGGQTREVEVHLTAPAEPGKYIVQISAVQEGVAWFMDAGGGELTLSLTVR